MAQILVYGDMDWSDGWIIFLDANEDLAIDTILRVYGDVNETTTIQYSGGDVVVFDGLGLLVAGSVVEEYFSISDSGDATRGEGVSIRPTGRIRMCANWIASTTTCADN